MDEIGEHFPQLEVVELIGAGGMGAVFRARQPKLDRTVALKIISPELASEPDFLERFRREARVLAKLHHPHIVTIFDTGTAGPFSYLIMEFVDGMNLREAIDSGLCTPTEALMLVQDICTALEFAHDKGVLHRDIKPENILIDSHGRVRLADFGIAKLLGNSERRSETLTQQNLIIGSPRYMAPEQSECPGDVDQRADIYSLGVVLYELLTGEVPMGRFAPPSEKANVDARVDQILFAALASEPTVRLQTADEFKSRLVDVTAPKALAATTGSALATQAAIFTGVSLALALVSTAYFLMMLEKNRVNAIRDSSLFMVLAVEMVLVGVPGVLGMLFGWRVLCELRGSRGAMAGLDTALIGALPWPLITGFGLVGITLWAVLDAANILPPALLFAVISMLLGGVLNTFVIRSVLRWLRSPPPDIESGGQSR